MDIILSSENINSLIKKYEDNLLNLGRIGVEFKYIIKRLADNGVKGETKKALINYLYADWDTGFNQYVNDIELLKDELNKVEKQIRYLEDEGKQLKK